MDLPAPLTLAEVVTDGIIDQAGVDLASPAVTGVEFSAQAGDELTVDAPVQVRLYPGPRTVSATRVARIDGNEWTWLSDRAASFPVPEFTGPQPVTDDLLRAARTLYGNSPALLVPRSDGVVAVVVLDDVPARAPMMAALASGWGAGHDGAGVNVRRALASYAATQGRGLREEGAVISFENGPSVLLDGNQLVDVLAGPSENPVLTFADLRADAALVSAEHQLLIDGVYPNARIGLDLGRGTAQIVAAERTLVAGAQVIATVEHGRWLWAWADDRVRATPSARAADAIRAFGHEHALPLLTTPNVPASLARTYTLAEAVKPTLGWWTHAYLPLPGSEATAVVLLDSEQLRLPPASQAAMLTTLRAPVDSALDLQRAVGSYANFRGISLDGENLIAPDTGVPVHVTVAKGQISAVVRDTPLGHQQE